MYTEEDVRQAVSAALNAVAEFDEGEQNELAQHVDAGVDAADKSRASRIKLDDDASTLSSDDALSEYVEIARERKALEKRDKALSKRKGDVMRVILKFAEEATIMPPWKVGGATVYLSTRLWAKVHRWDDAHREDTEITTAERDRAIATLKEDPDTRGFVREDFNVQTLSSYFKDEVNEGRVKLDDEGKTVIGGIAIEEATDVKVRGA